METHTKITSGESFFRYQCFKASKCRAKKQQEACIFCPEKTTCELHKFISESYYKI